MTISDISVWLSVHGDFAKGVALLDRFATPSPTLRYLLSVGDTPFARQKLQEALRAVIKPATGQRTEPVVPLGQVDKEELIERVAEARVTSSRDADDITEASLPGQLQEVRRLVRDQHRQLVFLRGQLSMMPNGMDLRALAQEIVTLRRAVKAGWMRIERWRALGQDIPLATPAGPDTDALRAELQRLHVYLNPKRIEQRGTPEAKLATYRARKAEIESQLNGPPEAL